MKTLVIAEPGSCHEGRLVLMDALLDVAASAGCNVFKNQWTSSAERMAERRRAPEYLDSYRKLEYPFEWHALLRDRAHELGMQYACTAYLPEDVAPLANAVDLLKISSFEASDPNVLAELKGFDPTRLIVSTGMMNADDVDTLIETLDGLLDPMSGAERPRLLHCVSAYPCGIESLNLVVVGTSFRFDGLSDHSRDVRTGGWAVCAGARALEIHFRLDSTDPENRDYAVAFAPFELREYVKNVRDAEVAMGRDEKEIQPVEKSMLVYKVGR